MPLREIERFSVSYLQVLDEHGKLDAKLDPKIPKDRLHRLYHAMVMSRETDQRMLKLQRQGRIGTFPPSTGQEAPTSAAAAAMGPKDWYVGCFRDLGARWQFGESIARFLLYHAGWEEGNVTPGVDRCLPMSVPIASQIPHAVGVAYAMQYRGEQAAVVTQFGDGATSEGDFHEALNFAAVWKSPVVFICQNNQWAISMPRSAQTASTTIAQKAIAYQMPGIQVDGNDALAMYRAVREALERAYAGEGPTLIEAVTYRLMMHTTADDPKKYRSEEEVASWLKRDPIPRLRKYMESKKLWSAKQEDALVTSVRAEIDAAVKEFEAMSGFKPDLPFDHVFGTPHAGIEKQRAEFLAILPLQEEQAHG